MWLIKFCEKINIFFVDSCRWWKWEYRGVNKMGWGFWGENK